MPSPAVVALETVGPPVAFGKAAAATGVPLPPEGDVFLSACDDDSSAAVISAPQLDSLDLSIHATEAL